MLKKWSLPFYTSGIFLWSLKLLIRKADFCVLFFLWKLIKISEGLKFKFHLWSSASCFHRKNPKILKFLEDFTHQIHWIFKTKNEKGLSSYWLSKTTSMFSTHSLS